MAAYLNPANSGVSLPQLPLGPLTGFLSGMQLDTANQMNDRIMRDDDLQYMIDQIRRQNDQSNLAVTQANNQNLLKQAGILSGQYDSGAKQAQADAALTADISKNTQQTVQSQDQIRAAVAPEVVRMADYISQNGGKLDPTSQADMDTWQQFSKVMKMHGLNTPAFPDPGDTAKVQQWGQQAAKWTQQQGASYVNTIPYQQAVGELGVKGQTAKDVANIDAASRETVGAGNNAARVEAAKIGAQGGIERANILAANQRNAEQSLMATIKQFQNEPGGLTPQRVAFIRAQARLAFQQNDPGVATARTIAGVNPQDQRSVANLQAAISNSQAQADQWLAGVDPAFGAGGNAQSGTKQGRTLNNVTSLPADLQAGDVVNGHKFKGGDPKNKANWE